VIHYLLDANILSEPVKLRPSAIVIAKLDEHAEQIALPAPVLHELWYGVERMPKGNKRDRLQRYVRDAVESKLPILPYDGMAAAEHARQRADLAAQGLTPSFVDGQIAAIAIVHGLTLATRNVADFSHFSRLRVENWFEEP